MADGRIIIDTELDESGVEKGVNQLGDIAKKGLKVLTGALVAGGAAMTGLGIKAINLASDLDEVQNVVDVTFGDNAEIINQWAKEAAKSFGMSELAYKKYSGSLGAMLKSMGLTSEQVKNMSGNMVDLAGDMASFYNLDHDTAFEKIRAGISGETEPLKALGINMSVANLEAYALAEGISKPYAQMSQGEQVMLRYKYLMQATADAQGDFERTSDGLANQLRIAKLNMESLSADMGKLLLPVAQEAVKSFNDVAGKLQEAFSDPEVQESIKNIAESIGEVVKKLLEFAADSLPKLIEGLAWVCDNADIIAAGIAGIGVALMTMNVASMIMSVVEAFKAFKLANEGATVAQWLMNAAMAANPIVLIVGLIAGLIAAIVVLWNTNEDFRNAIIGAWEKIKEVAFNVWNGICDFFTKTIPDAFKSFLQFSSNIWDSICDVFTNAWNSVVDFFTVSIPQWFDDLIAWFEQLPYAIGYAIGEAFAHVLNFGIECWNWVTNDLPKFIMEFLNWYYSLPGKIAQALSDALNNIIQWGVDMYDQTSQYVSNTIENIVDWFKSLPGRITSWLDNTIKNVIQWGTNLYSKATQAASDTVHGVINWFEELPGKMVDIGSNIISGIWNGMLGAKDWLLGKISSFCSGILDGFTSFFDIHSPSRLMRDIVGTNIVKGISVGVDSEIPDFTRQLNGNLDDLANKLKTTVDYEVASTTAGVVAQNNYYTNYNSTKESDLDMRKLSNIIDKVANRPVVVAVEGKEIMTATAPYQDVWDEWNEGR